MTETSFLTSPEGRRLAYRFTPGKAPGVIFCGGFKSDMQGSKALALEAWAKAEGRAFLRFDYSGHGESEGDFEAGAIGDWYEDARAAFTLLGPGRHMVVGSSMGGWISLLLARALPAQVAGLALVAPAPDFTEDLIWESLSDELRAKVLAEGRLEKPSEYSEAPYVYTLRLIEEGRSRLVLRQPLPLPFPVRILHGSADDAVPVSVSLRLLEHADCPDLRLTVLKDGDHRLSNPAELQLLTGAVAEIIGLAGG